MIDFEILLVSADHDKEWAIELFKLFKTDTSERIDNIEKMLISNFDADIAVRHFHTIKGSAGSIGAIQLRKTAFELEMLAKSGNYEEVRKKASTLRDEYKQTCEYFELNIHKVKS